MEKALSTSLNMVIYLLVIKTVITKPDPIQDFPDQYATRIKINNLLSDSLSITTKRFNDPASTVTINSYQYLNSTVGNQVNLFIVASGLKNSAGLSLTLVIDSSNSDANYNSVKACTFPSIVTSPAPNQFYTYGFSDYQNLYSNWPNYMFTAAPDPSKCFRWVNAARNRLNNGYLVSSSAVQIIGNVKIDYRAQSMTLFPTFMKNPQYAQAVQITISYNN